MKIVQVHNYYKQPGGESSVVKKEKKLLKHNNNQVLQYTKDNKEIAGIKDYIQVALNTRYSKKVYKNFKRFLKREFPDIVHIHNFFPLITPSIFDCTIEKNIPSILTLHNYRLLHPNGLMLNDGKVDERSVEGSAYRCVLDRVYRNSIIQTAVVANMIEYHRKKKTWQTKVDGFIALTEFAKEKFVEGGLPAKKIYVKPNFVEDPIEKEKALNFTTDKQGYLFLGRISKEKGIEELIEAWIQDKSLPNLFIAGDGPLKNDLEKKTLDLSNINWLGRIPNEKVLGWLKKVKAMIFPSICYEGFPMTILEAFSVGCPVICSNIGSQQSIIDDEITGLHFEVGNKEDLLGKVLKLEQNVNLVNELGSNAREKYLKEYTPEKNYKMLMNIYSNISTD